MQSFLVAKSMESFLIWPPQPLKAHKYIHARKLFLV